MISYFRTQRNYGGTALLMLLLLIQISRFLQLFVSGYEFKLLHFNYSLTSFLVNTAVIYGCGFLLNNIANRYQFFESASNLPAAVFFLFCAFIPYNQNISPWLLVLVLLILIFNKLVKAYQKDRPGRNYFDSAFLMTIICFIYPQYTVFILALLIATFILSMPKWANLSVVFTGALLSAILMLCGLYLTHSSMWLHELLVTTQANFTSFKRESLYAIEFPSVLLSVIFTISYVFWLSRRPFLSNYQRPILQLSTLFSVMAIVAVALFLDWQLISLLGMFFSLALLFSFFLFYNKSFLANVLFWLITGYAIAYPWIKDLNLNL